jgi:hypothetical protein
MRMRRVAAHRQRRNGLVRRCNVAPTLQYTRGARRWIFAMRPLAFCLLVIALFGAVASLAACAESPPGAAPAGPPARRAFYYWRTTFQLSAAEQRALAELAVTRLYVRAFDVVWDADARAAQPIGALASPATATRAPAGVEIVPVVFVRAGIFTPGHLDDAGIAAAARMTWQRAAVAATAVDAHAAAPREIQLDCDWTDTTRAGYFAFIRAVRAAAGPGIAITATIRLHQVKYRERTGVPPVDRGTLMFYNMGRFSADPDARAIFDAPSAARYLARIPSYPLPLDVALPIWSWTLQLRDGAVVGLLQSTDPDELPALPFLQRAAGDRFVATETTFLHGALLRAGDTLKIEVTGDAEAQAAAELVAPALPPDAARTVTLFDLSERNLSHHGTAALARVYDAVR